MNARNLALATKVTLIPIFMLAVFSLFLVQPAFAQEGESKDVKQAAEVDKVEPVEADKSKASPQESSPEKKTEKETSSSSAEEDEIISISDALKQGQLAHEKNLVDKFLLGIAVLFLVIAFLLFNSLPPSSQESGN